MRRSTYARPRQDRRGGAYTPGSAGNVSRPPGKRSHCLSASRPGHLFRPGIRDAMNFSTST